MGAISTTTETDIDVIVRNNIPPLDRPLGPGALGRERPAGLCLVGGDLRRRCCEGFLGPRFRRRLYLALVRPPQCLWVEQGFLRPAGVQHAGWGPARRCPPCWFGPQILQRLWPKRIPQGRPALRRGSNCMHIIPPRKRPSSSVPVPTTLTIPDGGQLRDFVWVGDCVPRRAVGAPGEPVGEIWPLQRRVRDSEDLPGQGQDHIRGNGGCTAHRLHRAPGCIEKQIPILHVREYR